MGPRREFPIPGTGLPATGPPRGRAAAAAAAAATPYSHTPELGRWEVRGRGCSRLRKGPEPELHRSSEVPELL
eukprot:6432309-Alexandrium_andersonii.AAC.1